MFRKKEYLNAILSTATRYGAEVIVYADVVADYVRERYGMRCVLSTTRALADVAELNRMTKRYDYVVLDYNRHKDPAFLEAIEDPGKVEVMVNEFCVQGCPHRQEHYLRNSEDQMSGSMRPFECVAKRADFFDHEPGHPVIFTDDEVRRRTNVTASGTSKSSAAAWPSKPCSRPTPTTSCAPPTATR